MVASFELVIEADLFVLSLRNYFLQPSTSAHGCHLEQDQSVVGSVVLYIISIVSKKLCPVCVAAIEEL